MYQLSTSFSNIYAISLHSAGKTSYKIRITTLDLLSGKQQDRYTLGADSEVSGFDMIHYVGANVASPIIVWSDKPRKILKVNVIGSKDIHTFKIPNAEEEVVSVSVHAPHLIQSLPHFLVHYQSVTSHWAEVYHIDLATSVIAKSYDLPKIAERGAFSTSSHDANVYFVRNTETESTLVSSASDGILERFSAPTPSKDASGPIKDNSVPIHAVSEVNVRSKKSYAVRSALTFSTGDWVLVRNGERTWQRPEALAGAIAAVWAELSAEMLAETFQFKSKENVIGAYINRVNRHVRELTRFPTWLNTRTVKAVRLLIGITESATHKDELQRDSYGFNKLAIIATESGRLYALNVGDHGKVVWSVQVAELASGERWSVKKLWVNNQKSHINIKTARGDWIIVDVMNGKIHSRILPELSAPLKASVVVSTATGQEVLDVHENGEIKIPISKTPLDDKTLVTYGNGSVKGLRFVRKEANVRPIIVWEFIANSGERIVKVTTRPRHDPVASIGRVLGDRSVMYKYLNPNLMLITTVNAEQLTATFHLVDSISGRILHSLSQRGVDASRTISTAMSENWFVYTFWGDTTNTSATSSKDDVGTAETLLLSSLSYKGQLLGIAELYESSHPNDRGPLQDAANFSSLRPSLAPSNLNSGPHVIVQTFFIPEPLTHLQVTQTRQGITSRSILGYLPSSQALIAIPKALLDPRRPVGRDPSASELEEGLVRRMAQLEFDPRWILSHRRPVMGLRGVITSPTLLESTSLVFGYGLDVFGTRVAPSMVFDMLGREFAKVQLIGTILALGVGVVLLAPLVRRKAVDGRWIIT